MYLMMYELLLTLSLGVINVLDVVLIAVDVALRCYQCT
jgi:hypothetical protein